MLKQLWQWLKTLWKRLFSRSPQQPTPERVEHPPQGEASLPPLSDTDLEFLFNQLLEGVANGWQTNRVKRFFEQTEDRVSCQEWIEWLKRFAQRVLSSPQPNPELARRLLLVAVRTQNLPVYGEVGALSNAISQELQKRMAKGEVWEYDGPDAGEAEQPQMETLTLEELHERLKQDENLRSAIARQVGVESDDPMVLLQALTEQLQQDN
ncbi:hypothetical protein PN462_05345 [Spirulina sp. CS-785/01]|uniref:hypothetical protein n=1 Tax=Spirulina sp. CS-785/01 TaxID=3021716 RepID=UPI00232D9A3F|nr:hypothetical protein [Spirulina sp. CS-785/01]MDB9312522.1 hypothetical protein [Spirulina sp. CS-785/01]